MSMGIDSIFYSPIIFLSTRLRRMPLIYTGNGYNTRLGGIGEIKGDIPYL